MREDILPGGVGFTSRVKLTIKDWFKAPVRFMRRQLLLPITERQDKILGATLCAYHENLLSTHPNPLNRCGAGVFSQSDEDGITCEIVRRLGISQGVFAEFGVGNGTENNTIVLAALGWSGFWAGGQELAFVPPAPRKGEKDDFAYLRQFITRENIVSIAREALEKISESEIDVLSLDLDGNDAYFVEELLSKGILPKLFIVEYNGKYIPPIRWRIEYNPNHTWQNDDYYGASLMEFNDIFERFGYFLASCNSASGSNAFFVHSSCSQAFTDIPKDIRVLWSPPRYRFEKNRFPVSARTVSQIINNIAAARASNRSEKPVAAVR